MNPDRRLYVNPSKKRVWSLMRSTRTHGRLAYVRTSTEVVARCDACHPLVALARKLTLHHGNGGPQD
jgi:hypothetical protein